MSNKLIPTRARRRPRGSERRPTLHESETVGTTGELAAALRVSERAVRDWIKAGLVRAIRIGPRTVRIPRSEFNRLTGSTK